MASSGERRMVFDTRGRRKHVVRVVYAILALMMGASLFLVVGPVNIGALLGNQSASSSAAKVFEEQSERIEGRLAKDPTNEDFLLALTRARLGAGTAQLETNPATGAALGTPESRANFKVAENAWQRYLKQAGDEASPSVAQLVAASYFKAAEGSASFREAETNVATAAEAQRIAADQRPSLGTLSTLAIYQLFNGEFAGAEKSTKQAAAKAGSKAEGKAVEKQLAEYRKNAQNFAQQKKELAKAEREVGKEKLTGPNPFSAPGTAAGE